MLVLTRKLGEAIRIGDDVELYVVGVSRGKVKLGFKAPRNIAVQRAELPDRRFLSEPGAESMSPVVPIIARSEMATNPPLALYRSASGA